MNELLDKLKQAIETRLDIILNDQSSWSVETETIDVLRIANALDVYSRLKSRSERSEGTVNIKTNMSTDPQWFKKTIDELKQEMGQLLKSQPETSEDIE